MALTDINFYNSGDGESYLFEIPTGTLNSPKDILSYGRDAYPVTEVAGVSTGGNIFIMSE